MWADVFTYLDGVETNLAFLIKTTSRFRETERTLFLQIAKLQNNCLIIAQSPAAPALLCPMIL